jgi:NADH:ubiquinone oxidoreductase subunit K
MGVIINKINKILKKLVVTILLFPIGLLGLICMRILISSLSLLLETLTNVKF